MTHRPAQRGWRRLHRHNRGYTVVELMVTVAILGILSAVVIDVGWREWRREQVNSVVLELASWLQSVRRAALKGNSCLVTIQSGSLASGAQLAQISGCSTVQALRLSGISGNRNVEVSVQGMDNNSFTFTPAGTLFPAPEADPDLQVPIVISVRLDGDADSGRCLQLDGLLGALDLGVLRDDACVVGAGI